MTKKRKSSPTVRRLIQDSAAILTVPWPEVSVSEEDQRAAARGLGRSSHLPSPVQTLPFHKNKN